jgi:hypothetical protein
MLFRQDSIYVDLILDPRSEPVSFEVPDLRGTVVTLRPPTQKEVERLASKQGVNRVRVEAARAEAIAEFDPSDKIAAAFKALDERRLPKDSPPRGAWPRDFDYISKDLQIESGYIAPASILSKSIQDFISQTRADLRQATRVVFENVRWRLSFHGPHDPVQFGIAYWSLDGERWEHLPTTTYLSISDSLMPRIDSRRGDIQELVDAETREPLAHTLWHEASQQRGTNPRSAILIGIAALEVGIKHYATLRIPDAKWLINEVQSPPIHRMLTEFLPKLPPLNGKSFEAPNKLTLETIRKGVNIRNEVTHKGVKGLKSDTVNEVLSTVRSLLWKLDAAGGVEWAEEYATSRDQEEEDEV